MFLFFMIVSKATFQYEFTTPDRGHGESPVNKKPRGEEEKEIGIDELSSK